MEYEKEEVNEFVDIDKDLQWCITIDEWIDCLETLKLKYPGKSILDLYSGYSNISYGLKFKRLETDEEFDKRVSKLKKDQENKENSERKLLEKLKRKYEK